MIIFVCNFEIVILKRNSYHINFGYWNALNQIIKFFQQFNSKRGKIVFKREKHGMNTLKSLTK